MQAVCVEGLSKSYDGLKAVNDLELGIDNNRIFGLLGPNGAGKTTTLRMITGLLKPDSGRITVYDRENWGWKDIMGFVPEEPALYEHLTVYEHIEFVGKLREVEGLENKVEGAIELFDLGDKADELVSTLSKGMKQKVAIACATIHSPKLLVCDEPLMGLDPKSQKRARELMRAIADDGGCVLVSTHILDVAERFCDEVAIMDRGGILAHGSLEELRHGKDETLEEIFLKLTGEE